MRLLRVELRRFRARRAVAVVLLLTTLLCALLLASTLWSTRPATGAELQDARDQVAQELASCQDDPEGYLGSGASTDQCEQVLSSPDQLTIRPPLDLRQELDSRGLGLVVVLVGATLVLATTFAGADWSSGSMSPQLLVEPRRTGVWLAKAVAVVLSCVVPMAVLTAAFWAVLYAVARSRGLAVPDAALTDVLQQSGRSLALVAAAALGAHALVMLLRSTVGTLGLLFGYAVAGEAVVASLPFDKMSQWSLANNVQAWVAGGTRIYDPSICPPEGGGCSPTYLLSQTHGAAYLGVLLLVVVVLSPLVFRRRDLD